MFRVPHPVRADELVHPYLAPAAAVIARWLGRESMHAGRVRRPAAARSASSATREAGKSSTLAWLARAGVDVLCDDMLIVDGDRRSPARARSTCGPTRPSASGVGEPIGMTGARERWRLRARPDRRPTPSLAGWVFLAWGDAVEARRAPGARAARRGSPPQRGLRLPPARPDALLELTSLPAWELSRPRGWESLPRGSRPAARARVSQHRLRAA